MSHLQTGESRTFAQPEKKNTHTHLSLMSSPRINCKALTNKNLIVN